MVFQSGALFDSLTVAENILFVLKVRRVSRALRDARLKRVVQLLGLERLLSLPRVLPGQVGRVADLD